MSEEIEQSAEGWAHAMRSTPACDEEGASIAGAKIVRRLGRFRRLIPYGCCLFQPLAWQSIVNKRDQKTMSGQMAIPSIGVVFAILVATNALGADLPCPSKEPAQFIPFDGTDIVFESTRVALQKGQASALNCVAIEKAPHEYRIDWPDAQLANVYTDKGVLKSATYIEESAAPAESTAYVGANRTKFTPKLLKERSILRRFEESILSVFEGSVSTASREKPEPARLEKIVPVRLEFECRLSGDGRAQLRFIDKGPLPPGGIGFSLPEASRRGLEGLAERQKLAGEYRSVAYTVGGGKPEAKTVAITLLNSDFQDIGTIPITIIASSAER